MEKRKKVNKLKVSIVIILIVLALTITVFGRYIYNTAREAYLTSKQFYFTSNVLAVNPTDEYQYNNWAGVGVYEIEIDLYSYTNELSKLDYDLNYTVTCETENSDKVKCTINSYDENATNTVTGTIPYTTNTSRVVIFVTPIITKINEGETISVTVTAKTEEPYEKELSRTFELNIENQGSANYEIEDVANRDYALLKIENVKDTDLQFTLEFDPNELRLDMNDEIYQNNVGVETSTIDGKQYVKKIVFNLSAEDSKNVKFYKVDKTQNYTYPGVEDTSAITVTI